MILVTYDLKQPGRNYRTLIDTIKSLGEWRHDLESTWLVRTNLKAEQVAAHLRLHIDDSDRLLVIEVKPYCSDGWLTPEAWTWIHNPSASYR